LGWREGQKNNGTEAGATDGGEVPSSATAAEVAAPQGDSITFQ